MKDLLDDFVAKNILSKASVLKYVDDYSIYSFYIKAELELYTKYSSPLRKGDNDPSFSLYYSKYQPEKIWFKDNATGKNGDVFKFLRYLMGGGEEMVHLKTALLQINSDFGLGLAGEEVKEFKPQLIKTKPLKKDPTKIEVTNYKTYTEEYLTYWENLEIPKAIRDLFYVTNVEVIHYINEVHISITAKALTIAYEILGHYKVYQPFGERKYKFRNNYLDVYVEGALQLSFTSDFVIITKSTKECMWFLAHFNWEAVAGKSENTPINEYFMEEVLRKKYKRVFIWLDNDRAGQEAQERYCTQYPWLIPVVFDSFIKDSDPTDLFLRAKELGQRETALKYIKQLIIKKL